MSRKELYLVAALAAIPLLIFLLILIAWSPWSRFRYHGDGMFSDELFFYPRYHVRFADIPLNQTGERHFHFRGMPNEEMSLLLYIRNSDVKTEADREPLMNLPTTIEATLKDATGNVVCHALGRPADGNRDGIWVLMSGPGEAAYWHYQCNFVQVSPNKTYDLTVRVADVGKDVANIVVMPELQGGGIELP